MSSCAFPLVMRSNVKRWNVSSVHGKTKWSIREAGLAGQDHRKYQTPGILEIHLDNVHSAAIHWVSMTAIFHKPTHERNSHSLHTHSATLKTLTNKWHVILTKKLYTIWLIYNGRKHILHYNDNVRGNIAFLLFPRYVSKNLNKQIKLKTNLQIHWLYLDTN